MAGVNDSERIARLLTSSSLSAQIRASIERAVRIEAFLLSPWFYFGPKWGQSDAEGRVLDVIERLEEGEGALDAILQNIETNPAFDEATAVEGLSTWIDGALSEVASWPSSFADSLDALLAGGHLTTNLRSSLLALRDETISFARWVAQTHEASEAWRLLKQISDSDLPMRQALIAAREGHLNEAELMRASDLAIAERRNRVSGAAGAS